eukprot:CAMPEP_0170207474 /NCGR_PEP_ID=MMETSP0116_2-20130129/3314_1 /TAXON_ID=400756 /ORGANISM="Durinskia baltica, Strain CSIRO CS-38" /LENGTH=1164 /DNA_ID=CAMNT_0010457931 /DNA_START=4517 /DNA_END=8013 /DNA_ORIENTATION=+
MVYPADSLARFLNQIQSSSSRQLSSRIFVPKRLRSSGPDARSTTLHSSANTASPTSDLSSSPDNQEQEQPSFPNNGDANENENAWEEHDTSQIQSDGEEEADDIEQANLGDHRSSGNKTSVSNRPISIRELCTFEIMDLLDSFGAPRYSYDKLVALLRRQKWYSYDKLVALLRRQKKEHGFDVSEAICRDTFLDSVKKFYTCPKIETRLVQNRKVFLFPFVDMLEDLVNDVQVQLHMICPSPTNLDTSATDDELWNTPWMRQTFECSHRDFCSQDDIMLPIILYMDKTGTDAYQRYSLEPILFSTAANPGKIEMGFIPSSKDLTKAVDKLQFHHDCLAALLGGIRAAHADPPLITIKDKITGSIMKKRARVPLMMIMGDQPSQDTLCSRLKANAGGAGRVHRSCMCSYMTVDDPSHKCHGVPQESMSQMTTFASLSDTEIAALVGSNQKEIAHLKRVRNMNRKFLEHPFGCYPIKNAFDGMDFGAWPCGVYDACVDDFMHSCELGLIKSVCDVLFEGLQHQESHAKFHDTKSSVRNTYPRWRLNAGFSRQNMMTSTERVGSLFSLCLALQHEDIKSLVRKAHKRQIQKYEKFPETVNPKNTRESGLQSGDNSEGNSLSEASDSFREGCGKGDSSKYFFEQHCSCEFTEQQVSRLLTDMARHGFDLNIIRSLDVFQIRLLMIEANTLFKNDSITYPGRNIGIYYQQLGAQYTPNAEIVGVVFRACILSPREILGSHRFQGVDNVKIKHMRYKPKTNEKIGSTAAILSDDMNSVAMFFEYVLSFHSFCKYSATLPPSLRDNFDLVEIGGRTLVRYFERMFYRGDNSIDSRTTKVHVHLRVGMNYRNQRNLMHSSCETGERLLKTEAKGISKTAQQRGEEMFEKQTCQRIQDRHVMDMFGVEAEKQYPREEKSNRMEYDRFSRREPHFILHRDGESCYPLDAKGKKIKGEGGFGEISDTIKSALLNAERDMKEFHIYLEAILRDNSSIKAFPIYRQEKPWYDFVNIIWEGGQIFPARCVCFYKKYDECGLESLHALVHVTDESTFGRVQGFSNSLLTSHYKMKYHRNQPVFYVVKLESIDSAILCFPHVPTNTLFDPYNTGVMVVRPRNEWAYVWLAWTEVLKEENSESKFRRSKRRQTRRYVSMGDPKITRKAQARVKWYLEAYAG